MTAPTAGGAAFDIEPHRAAVTAMVRTASRRALDWYRRPMAIENKLTDGYDPVTAADRAVEDEIRAGLARLFPDHAILGEERGESGDGPVRWTVDPIDGTRAFVIGHPLWGALVGLQIDGVPVGGWMHLPVLDETYVATPSGGEVVFGDPDDPDETRPLEASAVAGLADAVLTSTSPDMFAADEIDDVERLRRAARLVRFSGDCANYGLLAAGHVDLVVESGLQVYDIVPLIPIIEASGAVITDRRGAPPLDGGFVVAAASAELHAAALDLLGPG